MIDHISFVRIEAVGRQWKPAYRWAQTIGVLSNPVIGIQPGRELEVVWDLNFHRRCRKGQTLLFEPVLCRQPILLACK